MNFQRTIKKEIEITGIGLHSGKEVQMKLIPAPPHSGILFARKDLKGSQPVLAHFKNVSHTFMATTLTLGEVKISTIEHLMAALSGTGIDNLLVEVDGAEVPILDGSSEPFYRAIMDAGVVIQKAPAVCVRLKKRIEVKVAEKWAIIEPSEQLEIQASVDWDHPAIGFQEFRYCEGTHGFEEISKARTFGFMKDVEALKAKGLILGGSLDNAVVLDQAKVLNPEGLRYTNEFARHKVLDAIGDFKLAGVKILAKIRLHRAGHDLHRQILAEIFRSPSNYEIVTNVQPLKTALTVDTKVEKVPAFLRVHA
jgi:UDP-3-O-[3-hydroxymyristoyl] N-acetylglucosamine deacetylase